MGHLKRDMKKIYDFRTGHYITVNEAEADTAFNAPAKDGENNAENNQNTQQQTVVQTNKSVEQNAEIQKVNVDLDAENKRYTQNKQSILNKYNTDRQALTDQLTSAQDAAAKQDVTSNYDKVQTNRDVISLRKKMLDVELKYAQDINRIELEHATKVNQIENNRLQILQKLNNEAFRNLPEKYRMLNESSIGQAKLYMNTLVGDDDESPVRGMTDFKHMFQDTDLVYGKDKNGYYVLCVDREDFNKICGAMTEFGYLRDEIIGTLMPQILDRSGMLS